MTAKSITSRNSYTTSIDGTSGKPVTTNEIYGIPVGAVGKSPGIKKGDMMNPGDAAEVADCTAATNSKEIVVAETADVSNSRSMSVSEWGRRFGEWRVGRPFFAGLLTMPAGIPITCVPYANVTVGQFSMRPTTTAGSSSLIITTLLVMLGFTMWFHPTVRVFAGSATIALALFSIPMCNLGGLLIGLFTALLGASLSIAWNPDEPAPPHHAS
ncbi:DUF6114 domain-containing protein [Streptomyces sp. NPDC086787]|uniref:DUF6114 domain-containing protein n=1 Tax=Streptomyces sp. NPDC086787 TaxID=3365759 RepID=UPI00382360B4